MNPQQRRDYSAEELLAVWSKGQIIAGYSNIEWRRDSAGNAIRFHDYGETSDYGWVVDHIVPLARGELDAAFNWQTLYWRENLRKGAN